MTIGVVIGDSIALGFNGGSGNYGRLNQSEHVISYDDDYPDVSGQFSSEFTRLFGFRWYNHGIRGQTTAQIWARWRRDVLGETYDPSDGAGSLTLPSKTDYVYVHVGCNDIYQSVAVSTIQNNLLAMAESCQNNNIKAIFSNIPYRNDYDATKRTNMATVNSWMNANLPSYGVVIFNENLLSQDINNPNKVRFAYYHSDGIHPNEDGYRVMSIMVYETYISSL